MTISICFCVALNKLQLLKNAMVLETLVRFVDLFCALLAFPCWSSIHWYWQTWSVITMLVCTKCFHGKIWRFSFCKYDCNEYWHHSESNMRNGSAEFHRNKSNILLTCWIQWFIEATNIPWFCVFGLKLNNKLHLPVCMSVYYNIDTQFNL